MPTFAVLIAATPSESFYSQVAALSLALRRLSWVKWTPRLHLYLGGEGDLDVLARWRPYLHDVELSWVSERRFDCVGDWSQSDDVFSLGPRDAEILVAFDADMFPVVPFEDILDGVLRRGAVAGCIAHFPFPGSPSPRSDWERLAAGQISVPLDYAYRYSLLQARDDPESQAPFYLNFGAVFFGAAAFERVARRYLAIRPSLESRMSDADFSGQAALTLAVTDTDIPVWELPLRYNFPNDEVAERLYPDELREVVMFHYLRTHLFDRHHIFTSRENYMHFLGLELEGVNGAFQNAVRGVLGEDYPFG